ncbi:MAG: hypothetical protein JSR96_10330 [Proteobacteria bacterium]|nr:hypothetical protein [Pseudomonadota bacterium]
MTDLQSKQLVDAALERAAEQLGDIVPPVMARYFAAHPDAEVSFVDHQPDNPLGLQAEMVGNTLYFVMTWHERPKEIEITLGTSIPHHIETLKVPAHWYSGLIDAVIDVVAETASPLSAQEAEMWTAMKQAIGQLIALEASR